MIERVDAADMIDHALANDAIEPIDANEPIDPMDSTLPTEPMDRIELRLPMLRIESRDRHDHLEFPASATRPPYLRYEMTTPTARTDRLINRVGPRPPRLLRR